MDKVHGRGWCKTGSSLAGALDALNQPNEQSRMGFIGISVYKLAPIGLKWVLLSQFYLLLGHIGRRQGFERV